MGCRRTSSLVVAALLVMSLLIHRLPVSCARHYHVAVLKVNNNNGSNNRGDMQKLVKRPVSGSADDSVANNGFEGRKLGSRNMEEAEAMGVKGDQKENVDVSSRPKPQGSQMEQQGLAGSAAARRRRPASSAAESGTAVEMRAAGKHADPTTEVYDMLRRDYTWKASRRKPIHNGEEEP